MLRKDGAIKQELKEWYGKLRDLMLPFIRNQWHNSWMGWVSFETYVWFMDKTAPLSSFFLTDSWHSAGCGVLFFCTFEITSNPSIATLQDTW
jgi:hypothetical protein